MRRVLFASVLVLSVIMLPAGPASAYEYQTGPGISCSSPKNATIQTHTYGDYNVYSNYSIEGFEYNIPYWTLTYVYVVTSRFSISASAAEAENYVSGNVNTTCWP